jgi:hypothetical protein
MALGCIFCPALRDRYCVGPLVSFCCLCLSNRGACPPGGFVMLAGRSEQRFVACHGEPITRLSTRAHSAFGNRGVRPLATAVGESAPPRVSPQSIRVLVGGPDIEALGLQQQPQQQQLQQQQQQRRAGKSNH